MHPFKISNEILTQLIQNKSLEQHFSSLEDLAEKLETSLTNGLCDDDTQLSQRYLYYGENYIVPRSKNSFFFYLVKAFQDTILIFLLIGATISLIIGLSSGKEHGWIEGVAIFVAIFVIAMVTAVTDYHKEVQFVKLQKRIKLCNKFSVIRYGEISEISTKNITVGDLILLKYGDQIPADSIVISCNDLCVDESTLTGESNLISKDTILNRFLLSGTNIMKGSGKAIVLAVGINSQSGKILQLLGITNQKLVKNTSKKRRNPSKKLPYDNANKKKLTFQTSDPMINDPPDESNDNEDDDEQAEIITKNSSVLQSKLTKLAFIIGKFGFGIGIVITVILLIRFCVNNYTGENRRAFQKQDGQSLLNYVLVGITIMIVAIPEGLPLAITLSLALSVHRMYKDNNLVRHLYSCETMGNATTICSDKTGTLTTNRMTVVKSYICGMFYDSDVVDVAHLSDNYLDILCTNISINKSIESKVEPPKVHGGFPSQLGNKTECALIGFMLPFQKTVEQYQSIYTDDKIIKIFPFISEKKLMTTIVQVNNDNGSSIARVLTKGAPEYLLSRCSRVISNTNTMETETLNLEIKTKLKQVIENMASDGLRTIALAYKDISIESLGDVQSLDDNIVVDDMISLCLVGIEDPVRSEVPKAIKACQKSGVVVRMITGDNIITARSIAIKCGIYDPQSNHLVLDSAKFNRLIRDNKGKVVQSQLDKVWPRLRVLARSSPYDKYILVKGIIESKINVRREIVAVTGDGTNDAPALKIADIGFSMGISGTDVAKEASDIVITNDDFSSIVKAMMWGRNVYDCISKFIQFQLTVNVVAVISCVISSMIYSLTVMTTVQLLWVNLIMDSLASLALATDGPTPDLLNRPSYGRNKSLLSSKMIRFIVLHSLYQLTVVLSFIFLVPVWFGIPNGFTYSESEHINPILSQHLTMCFNVFVLMQICNEFNARRVHGERNVFRNMLKNKFFVLIICGTIILQVIIVQYSGLVFKVAALDLDQWMWCIFFATGELLYHQLIITLPPIKIRKKYRLGGQTTSPTDIIDIDRQLAELDVNARTLWIRGLLRLRQQLRVIKVFRDLVNNPSERLPTDFKMKYSSSDRNDDPNYKKIPRQWSVDYVPKKC